jgi:hypothetical protein
VRFVVEDKIADKKDSDFQNAWLSKSVTAAPAEASKKMSPVQRSLEEIKQYAYEAFDRLDKNSNGFIETDELYSVLEDANTPMREKSFITFLLNNQQEISDACKEDGNLPSTGISRLDLEFYFRLIIGQIK